MTAARQERKSRRFRALLVAFWGTAALAVGFAPPSIGAATTEWVVINRYTGLAIDGFDPVAYFVEGASKEGRADLELRSDGAVWRFRNEGNRAAFAGAPAVYTPRFGGHDPMAVARGAATPGHPALWLIAEQRLYLFYNNARRATFDDDPERVLAAAGRKWPAILGTLTP